MGSGPDMGQCQTDWQVHGPAGTGLGPPEYPEREGQVGQRYSDDGAEPERMAYLELVAQMISNLRYKGKVIARYY